MALCFVSKSTTKDGQANNHINGIAQIKLAKFGSVDMDFVLGVGGYDLERFDSEAQLDPYISLERCMCSSPDPCSFLSLAFKVKRK
ncbi:hypothetical protein CMV_029518 [Castanea mollissima]|uniref:Uncharacterized protein n=1 Tax=Castanea mollissima TaxID=60419 RepID=A0A8J4Q6P9_9ROSI|nr:hypothetical protein CMV_029518 [Castanea mollissima]